MPSRRRRSSREAAVDGGADIIELGFPFSDPLADGPVIRRAGERALARGMRTRACLDVLARTRELIVDMPLIPMTYSSLLEAYGWERFAADARAAGGTSMIVSDLPAGERPETARASSSSRRRRPTSASRCAAEQTDGWLYLVTLTGTTGARGELSPRSPASSSARAALTDVPLYAGFGISTPEHARGGGASSRTASSSARARCRSPRRARMRCATTSRRCARRSTRRLSHVATGSPAWHEAGGGP